MSVRAVTWVLHESTSTGNDRLVLIVIADEADNDGLQAFPSIERIAKLARVNPRTVRRCIARLEGGGDLLVRRPEHPGRGRFNRYTITMGRPPEALAAELGWPPPNLDPSVRAEWEAGQSDPLPDDPQPGDKPGDNPPGKGHKGDTRRGFGGHLMAADPKTLNDTTRAPRRRGLDPPAPSPLDRTARAARALEAKGRGQILEILAEPAPHVDVDRVLAGARAQLGALHQARLDVGDGSELATPNELDFEGAAEP